MILGLDARAAAEVPAGRGRVVRELLQALTALDADHRYLLYCRHPWEGGPLDERFEWVPVGAPDPLWHALAARRASRESAAFLSTNSYLTAWLLRVPGVVIVHDLIAFRPQGLPQGRAAAIERATIRPAIRRAARLVCNSAWTERDLVDLFPRAAGKSAVVPFAASGRFAEPRGAQELEAAARRHGVEPGAFVLAAGTLEPRKNLVRLMRAHAALPADLRSANPLLLVGPRGWNEQEILEQVGSLEHVRLAGYVPEDELVALYAACTLFCYPSLYEGFGLPVLEAMSAGAPVITSDVSSLPEVAGDAALLVEPSDEGSIRAALERLLRSPEEREELAVRGRRRAAGYSWERASREILAELERAARR